MAALQPNFVDKEDFQISPLEEKFKGTADSWNQLKNAAINHADLIDQHEIDIDINEQDIAINALAIFDLGLEVDLKVASVTGPLVNNSDPQNPYIEAGTTAGLTGSLYFTGDEVTLAAGTFYLTNEIDKGTVNSVQQVVVPDDNTREYFLEDLITIPQTVNGEFPAGSYAGFLSALLSTNTTEKQKFGAEVYRADADGNVISSGVSGAPIGSYGVTVVTLMDSGNINLVNGDETQVNFVGKLNSPAPYLIGERFRLRVWAEKVGAAGGAINLSVFYGVNHNSYVDLPISFEESGLELITENAKSGWRLAGKDPANFGDIGQDAVDLSQSDLPSGVVGATGESSYAEGYRTIASGAKSHAEGQGSNASGIGGHAEGLNTKATNTASHSEGSSTEANGLQSHAEGQSSKANGQASHAEGMSTIAQNQNSHAGGKWNKGTSPDTIREIGIGDGLGLEKNAFEVYLDGTLTSPESTPALIKSRGEKALIDKEYLNRPDQDATVQTGISGALVFDMSKANQKVTINGNITSITFINEPTGTDSTSAVLNIYQDGVGGFTVDWAGSGVHGEEGKTAADYQPGTIANQLTQYWLYWEGSFWVMANIKVSSTAL